MMRSANVAQPDITLVLDLEGVIREAKLSGDIDGASVDAWIGRPWTETVTEGGIDKVRRMVADACANRVSIFNEVPQRLPDGREFLVEYTTVRLGGDTGLIAVGKSLRAVADLQARLIASQQAMERDYWKLHQVEPRHQPVLADTSEAVLLVRDPGFRVIEANPVALAALTMPTADPASVVGQPLLSQVAAEEREAVRANLEQARAHERTPRFLAHLGPERKPWLLRASVMSAGPAATFLLRLSPAEPAPAPIEAPRPAVSVGGLIERMPDPFVIVDASGVVLQCNTGFLDLVQVGTAGGAVGENIGRWLNKPGADAEVLLANVRKHGSAKRFETMLAGEYGTETEVEISAAGDGQATCEQIAVTVRDISRRLPPSARAEPVNTVLSGLHSQLGIATLRELVKDVVGLVERFYIEEALGRTGGNRTAAAELLGLSRQNLYTKLDRYGLYGASQAERTED